MNELDKYVELPYTVLLRRDGEGDFVAKIDELPGCSSHGRTREEALANLDEAKTLWIQDCLENGDPVPVPSESEPLPSGKWLQRVPRKLHRKLQKLAKNESVSFNQYVLSLLSEAVGERKVIVQSERISFHPQEMIYTGWSGFLGEQNFEPLPNIFQVVNVAPQYVQPPRNALTQTLAMLSSQLPDKFELKSKVKKDAKRHPNYQIS
jgi:predicted RNase H-like HicB family nuclease